MNELNVARLNIVDLSAARKDRARMAKPDPALLLIAALIASAGPVVARRAEMMLSIFEGAEPGLSRQIAQAKKIAAEATRIADAAALDVAKVVEGEGL